jgi:hypothetical protein
MRRAVHAALGSAALFFCAAALGQQPAPKEEPSGEIVVTGQRDRDEQVQDFVRALTPAPSGAIARFVDEVCPATVGLAPEANEKVNARIRRIAAAIDLRVAKAGCEPNALIIVTPNKQALIERLVKERPGFFGALSLRQIRSLAKSSGPAAAWQLGGPIDEGGAPLATAQGIYVNRTIESQSRLKNPIRRGFDASAVVVETAALEGLTATQLADYAMMRLFAELDPARLPAPAPVTILNVLTAPPGTAVPITLTQWDLGLLRGLYASSPDLHTTSQRSEIAREVRKELEKPAR